MHIFTKLCAFIIFSTLSQQLIFAQPNDMMNRQAAEEWQQRQIQQYGQIANPQRPDLGPGAPGGEPGQQYPQNEQYFPD